MSISPSRTEPRTAHANGTIATVLGLLADGMPGGVAIVASATGTDRVRVADAGADAALVGREIGVSPELLATDPVCLVTTDMRVPLAWTMACGDRPTGFVSVPVAESPFHLIVACCQDHVIDADRVTAVAAVVAQLLSSGQRTRSQAHIADRVNSLVRHLPLPLVFVDSLGLQVFLNDEAGKLLGLPENEARAPVIAAALARLFNREATDAVHRAIETDLTADLGFEIERGGQIFDVDSHWVDDGILSGRIWIFTDVTEAKALQNQLSRLADEDALTGVLNRRPFERRIATEIRQAERGLAPPGLLLLDIDHFKRINDSHGHQAGDRVLQQLCRIVAGVLRQTDILARIGGEEFAILLPGAPLAPATDVANRICRAVRDTPFEHAGGTLAVTCSIGVTICYPPEDTAETMIARGDEALYAAKRAGRDRVVIAPPPVS